jgi:hypothetical protein
VGGTPEELLRGALEKIVFFECRVDQLQSEVAAARVQAARAREEAASSRRREAALEGELAQARAAAASAAAARDELQDRVRLFEAERERFLDTLLERARVTGAPADDGADHGETADLADFMSELRNEIERLRAWRRAAEAAGLRVGDDGVARVEGAAVPPPAATHDDAPEAAAAPEASPPPRAEARSAEPRERRSPAVPELAQRFERAGRIGLPPEVRNLAHGLATRSERALYESALDDLNAHDAATRRRAAERLRVLGARSAAPLVAAALGQEPDADAKMALLAALGALADAGAADLAIRELRDHRAPVRAAALEALFALARADAVPELARALGDPAPLVRRRAALLLGFSQSDAADEALATVLADRDPSVARAAAVALAGRPSSRAQGALARAIASPRPEVRRPAARAVGRWAGQPIDVEGGDSDRRALSRKMTDRLRELDASTLRGAVTHVTAAARPPASPAPAARRPMAAPRPPPQPGAASPEPPPELSQALLAEVRTALRGRTTAELAESLAAAPAVVDRAVRALAATGAVVARGARVYVA